MKNNNPFPAWLGLCSRIAIGAVLIAAGLMKASSPAEEFSVVIQAYQIVSPSSALTLATFLPWIEVFLGFCLLLGFQTRASAAASGALFAGFLCALASTKARGIELPNCGCFGAGMHSSITEALCLDAVLLLCAFFAYQRGSQKPSLDAWALGKDR